MGRIYGQDLNPADFGPAKPLNPGGGIVAPIGLPTGPKSAMDIMRLIRSRAKQALPAAPASAPPTAPGFKVSPVVALAGLGLVGYLIFRKKGARHG